MSVSDVIPDADAWMSTEEQSLASMLLSEDQGHVFAAWTPGEHEDKKHALFEQVKTLHENFPGGLPGYLKKARHLLEESKAGTNPFEGLTPSVPTGERLEFGSESFCAAEEQGLATFATSAFVLVAGGLGERLGYSGIKVSLPVEVTTGTCYLQLYAQHIIAAQHEASARLGRPVQVPLAIMTSDDTHAKTVELLKDNAYFELEPEQVTLMKQEKVAALNDSEAHVAMADDFAIATKPHGHGDVHLLLHSTGLAKKWADEGRSHVVFFQDTNAMFFATVLAALGVSAARKFAVNSVSVPRKAKEAMGAIAKLERDDGTSLTCNVEYNQLEPLLQATGQPEGDVNDPDTGYSPYPGNINQLIIAIPDYVSVLDATHGLVPDFVNPKYADESRTKFKKPTRLESMMQDLPKLLPHSAPVGFTQFDPWTFCPVKNALSEAKAAVAKGVPSRCASEGELEFYASWCRRLEACGAHVAAAQPWEITGFSLARRPHVVCSPAFAPCFTIMKQRVKDGSGVHINEGSTLVLDGHDIELHSLNLAGALIVRAVPGAKVVIKDAVVRNDGWHLQRLAELSDEEAAEAPEWQQIRGYRLSPDEAYVAIFTEPGEYVLSGELGAGEHA